MAETQQPEPTKKELRLEKSIEIAAPVAEVWKALTEGQELAKWFPLEARVTPGPGGKIFISWGPDFAAEASISEWQPEKTFAWKEDWQGQIAVVTWTLEARGQKTIVRMVQSGFSRGGDWENEWFASTNYGWGFMLAGLKFALEQHHGEERKVAWPRVKTALSREEVYRKLVAAGSLFVESPAQTLHAGREYTMQSLTGDRFSGYVEFIVPQRGFCVSVRELNNALLWLTIEGSQEIEVQAWLSAFGLPQADVDAFGRKWEARLKEVFAT